MRAHLYAGLFFDFFPFSRLRLLYFVLSALDSGKFKRFDDSIYRNLREMSLFILYVHKHDFESPWLVGFRMLTVLTATFHCYISLLYFIAIFQGNMSVLVHNKSGLAWH